MEFLLVQKLECIDLQQNGQCFAGYSSCEHFRTLVYLFGHFVVLPLLLTKYVQCMFLFLNNIVLCTKIIITRFICKYSLTSVKPMQPNSVAWPV